ncbi:hypothetical protein ILYODFUR_017102 [Ilyodon furcidens]|uniref:Uncharacterized protein n=1 Tax=Ilyodon furcidens TaxID=33524 RepID=A0ABV0TJC3_9TELE
MFSAPTNQLLIHIPLQPIIAPGFALKDLHSRISCSSAELRPSSTQSPPSGFKLLLTPLSPQASTPPPVSGSREGKTSLILTLRCLFKLMSLSASMSSTGVRAPKENKHQLINSSNCHLCVYLICESFQVEFHYVSFIILTF